MGDTHNENHDLSVEHFIDHPVIADAYATKAPQVTLKRVTRVRLLAEAVDGMHKALTIWASNLRQFSGCAALNPN